MISLLLAMSLESVQLTSLDLNQWSVGYGKLRLNQTVTGAKIVVGGKTHPVGLGAHAPGGATYKLEGCASRISGAVGVSDAGGGTVIFSVWGDGRKLWTSPTMRGGQEAKPFDVSLVGIQTLTLVMSDAMDGSGGDHANWLDVQLQISGAKPKAVPFMKTLTLLPDRTRQTIANFGASDSWTVEPLNRWPESKREEIATLLFDREKGIGLSCWRHNLGGGINHQTISIPFRTADTYDAGEGKFDWTRNPGQRWMLEAAKRHGVPSLVAYAVTAPRRMTRNGFTNGTDGEGSTNLREGQEESFAKYLVGVVDHFKKQGYPFTHLSPINEPDFEWNGVPSIGSQEGSRASNEDVMRITRAVSKEIEQKKLPLRLLTPEASSPQIGYTLNDGMTKKYGSTYGSYATMLSAEPAWRKEVNPVYAFHSYWAEGLGEMVSIRQKLRAELEKASPMAEVWMTEFCQLAGPRSEGGWGRDLGMTLALNMARLVQLDMTIVETSAWQWWLAVSDADYKDGLIYVDDIDKETGEIHPSKALWALGNFSRFIRPGFQRIETEGPFTDISSTLVSAYRHPTNGELVVVLVNPDTKSEEIQLNLPGRYAQKAYLTSDKEGQSLAAVTIPAVGAPFRMPPRSVMTLVLTPQ